MSSDFAYATMAISSELVLEWLPVILTMMPSQLVRNGKVTDSVIRKKSATVQATLCLCILGSTPTIAQRLLRNDPETDSTHYSNGKGLF
jgi:hypothetical protein